MLTSQDYQVLFPIALEVYQLTESSGSVYTQMFLESNLGRRFLVETLFLEISEAEAKQQAVEAEKEFAELAKEDEEGDTIFEGISRCFKVYEFIKKVINIAKGQDGFVFWPVSFLVGKVIAKMKEQKQLKAHLITQRALAKAQKELAKKYHTSPENLDPDKVARLARSLAIREKEKILQQRIGQLENQDLRFLGRIKLWSLKMWKKIYPEKTALKLAESVETLVAIAKRNPLLTGLAVVMTVAITIFTIFKWNKVKRFFGFLARIVTAPIRVFIKGVKWLFSKLTLKHKREAKQEFSLAY